ncbi:MAG: class I SAM-dependent methyltransferase [Caldilineae bacterium]|nr:MAG: class I SAM-dependent methyltransferase [Caldilineae bacterium]
MRSAGPPHWLSSHPQVNGVYHLGRAEPAAEMAALYLRVRKRERRLYDDDAVARLPAVSAEDPHAREWAARAESARRLCSYIAAHAAHADILELGCGNGWLSHRLALATRGFVVGIDVNLVELEQAARVFGTCANLAFAWADVFDNGLPASVCDVVVMAASLQYFADVSELLQRLLGLLRPGGEIHILDSPLYHPHQVEAARERSRGYYARQGVPQMASFYHHHTWPELLAFAPTILYDPARPGVRLRRFLFRRPVSPFPWLRIRRPRS